MGKVCKACGIAQPLAGFKKNPRCKDGVAGTCKSCVNIQQKAWRAKNPDHPKGNRSEVGRRYYERNREKVLEYCRSYRKENLGKYAHYEKVRHTRKLQAMPGWLNEEQLAQIEEFYRLASEASEPTHVDHIVPLQGKNVCGLHVPWNLQLLPAIDNIRKGNRF